MNQSNSGFMSSIPVVTRNIIIINILVWLATSLLSKDGTMSNYLALHYVTSDLFKPYQIITYMFMHGSLGHVFFNMFAVFMFGRTLEALWGPKRFLTYYILTGIGAALLQMIITYISIYNIEAIIPPEGVARVYSEGLSLLLDNKNYIDPNMKDLNSLINGAMVGASGAVFGILVAFGMLFPDAKLFVIPIPFPIKAKWFVIIYGVMELGLGIANNPNDNIAHFAHLGGLLTGFLIILYWRKKIKSNGQFH